MTEEEALRLVDEILRIANNEQYSGMTDEHIIKHIDDTMANHRHSLLRNRLPLRPADVFLIRELLIRRRNAPIKVDTTENQTNQDKKQEENKPTRGRPKSIR